MLKLDNDSLILFTIFMLMGLAFVMIVYFKHHKSFREREKARKAQGNHLRKV